MIIGYLRPLIEANKVIPITPPDEYCPLCFADKFASSGSRKSIRALNRWLKKRYLDETQLSLEFHRGMYVIHVEGPDPLVEHGGVHWIREKPPEEIENLPGLAKRLHERKVIKIPKTQQRKFRLHEILANESLQNIFFELACAQCLGTVFLFERELHVDLLNRFSKDASIVRRNQIIERHLTTLVPFIDRVSPEKLLELRNAEEEAFVVFRQSLNKAIQEYQNSTNRPFRNEDAKQIYNDIIAPGLSKLDQRIKASSRSLLKGTFANLLAWSGAITFGLYSGWLPADLVKVAGVLGLTKVLAELLSPAIKARFRDDSVKSEDLYFLWRVRRLCR